MTLFSTRSQLLEVVDPDIPASPAVDSYTLMSALTPYTGTEYTRSEVPDRLADVAAAASAAAQAELVRQTTLFQRADVYAHGEDRPAEDVASEGEARMRAAAADTGEIMLSPDELFGDDDNDDRETGKLMRGAIRALGTELQEKDEREAAKYNYQKALEQTGLNLSIPQAAVAVHALRRSARQGDVAAVDMLNRQPDVLRPAVSIPASYALGALLALSRAFRLR